MEQSVINSCADLQPRKVLCSELIARVIAVKVHRMKKSNCARRAFINVMHRSVIHRKSSTFFARKRLTMDSNVGNGLRAQVYSEYYFVNNDISYFLVTLEFELFQKDIKRNILFSQKKFSLNFRRTNVLDLSVSFISIESKTLLTCRKLIKNENNNSKLTIISPVFNIWQ